MSSSWISLALGRIEGSACMHRAISRSTSAGHSPGTLQGRWESG